MKKKCLVLLSGGIDSAVVLSWASNKDWKLATLSFLFPGRRKKEIQAVKKLCKYYHIQEHYEIPLPFLKPPQANQACYIPNRNLMYYAIAGSLAEKIGARIILGGHYRHDGEVFPDAKKPYLTRIEKLIQNSGKGSSRTRLIFPFINSSKKDIIQTGKRLNTPFHAAWSCSHDGRVHCWKCNSCLERRDGFKKAHVEDPLDRTR